MSDQEEQVQLKYRLIELVHNEPMLWNQRDAVYKSNKPTTKNLKWATFAGQLDLPDGNFLFFCFIQYYAATNNSCSHEIFLGNAVKVLWKSLCDQFSREAKKIPRFYSGMEAPEDYDLYTSWQFFPALLFLRNTVCAKRGSGNLENYHVTPQLSEVYMRQRQHFLCSGKSKTDDFDHLNVIRSHNTDQ
jgi:hypothetical protein